MKIILPEKIKNSINSLGNKTRKKNALKIYAALYGSNKRKNEKGYFSCPSTYLRKINARYHDIMERFIADGIIDFKKTMKIDPKDIFQSIVSKTYSSQLGYCMQYKFLIDISNGEDVEVDMSTNKKERWFELTANSLIELGYEPKITRDNFGRRVYYPLIQDYKTELKNKGLCIIDAKTSQPRLLWLIMKDRGIIDPNYHRIFSNNLDLYNYLATTLNLPNRDAGRDLFVNWLNGKGYVQDLRIEKIFPIATCFIRGLKKQFYKDSASFMQRAESKIWIDDLLENLPVEFALPVHDSLIIKEADYEKVMEYCQAKYPEIEFKRKEIGD